MTQVDAARLELDSRARLAEQNRGQERILPEERYEDIRKAREALPLLLVSLARWMTSEPAGMFEVWYAERTRP